MTTLITAANETKQSQVLVVQKCILLSTGLITIQWIVVEFFFCQSVLLVSQFHKIGFSSAETN